MSPRVLLVGVLNAVGTIGEASDDSYAPSIYDEEEAWFSSSQNVEDAQIADSSHVSTRGTKRVAHAQLEPELESLDVGESRKRPLEHDEGMLDNVGVCVADDCSRVHGIMQLSEQRDSRGLTCSSKTSRSVCCVPRQKSETVSFCGSSIKVWKPDCAVDDSTSNTLDGNLTFSGMLTEVKTLDCSAASMHTPLGKERKVIVRFPAR